MSMENRNSPTAWGMLLGLFIGAGLATMLFATTGEAMYFGLVGVGLALGLGLGAAFDRAPQSGRENGSGATGTGAQT
jgi:hypothetical protein